MPWQWFVLSECFSGVCSGKKRFPIESEECCGEEFSISSVFIPQKQEKAWHFVWFRFLKII